MSISHEINHCYSYNHHFYLYHQCVYQCVLIVITSMVTSALSASDNVYHLPHLLASSPPSSSLLNSISSTSSFRNNNHDRSGSSGLHNQRAKCETTLNTCSRDMRCAMALQDYRTSCSHLLNNKTRTCSEICRLALISLNSLPEGYDYLNCDCGDNDFCRKVRRRTSVCHLRFNNHLTSPSAPSSSSTSGSTVYGINYPLDSIPPAAPSTHSNRGQATLGSPFSSPSASSSDSHHRYKGKQTHHGSIVLCSTAEARCKEDETCSEAWEFFQVHCEKVFTGTECTKSCNNSLNILYRQRAAHHLDNCICSENSIPFSSRSSTPFTLTIPTFSSSSSSSSSSSTNSFNEWSCKRRKANIKRLCFGYSSPSALSGIASQTNSLHHSITLYQLLALQFIPIVSLIILNTILSVK